MSSLRSNDSLPNAAPIPNKGYGKLKEKAKKFRVGIIDRVNTSKMTILKKMPITTKEDKRYTKLKEKAGRFRVVIIGRANAGKTTILQKVCNTADNPEIYDGNGRKVDTTNIEPTVFRGYHTIENEMVFRSNPTFAFHDSCGFEAGGVDEFEKVKAFVAERAKAKYLKDRVHVIWYCIPMDDDRPITHAEKQFFSESGTGKVPVVAVFTKCEALELKAITALEEDGHDFDEAVERAPSYVEENYKGIHKVLEALKYPPKGHIYLQELDKPERDCQGLVECTTEALDSSILQGLFISTQENNLELAMKFSLRNCLRKALQAGDGRTSGKPGVEMFAIALGYFPYHYYSEYERRKDYGESESRKEFRRFFREEYGIEGNFRTPEEDLFSDKIQSSLSKLTHLHDLSVDAQLLFYCCTFPIISDYLSVVWVTNPVSPDYIPPAITLYQDSPSYSKVMCGVLDAIAAHRGPIQSSFNTKESNVAAFEAMLLPLIMENRLDKTHLVQ